MLVLVSLLAYHPASKSIMPQQLLQRGPRTAGRFRYARRLCFDAYVDWPMHQQHCLLQALVSDTALLRQVAVQQLVLAIGLQLHRSTATYPVSVPSTLEVGKQDPTPPPANRSSKDCLARLGSYTNTDLGNCHHCFSAGSRLYTYTLSPAHTLLFGCSSFRDFPPMFLRVYIRCIFVSMCFCGSALLSFSTSTRRYLIQLLNI